VRLRSLGEVSQGTEVGEEEEESGDEEVAEGVVVDEVVVEEAGEVEAEASVDIIYINLLTHSHIIPYAHLRDVFPTVSSYYPDSSRRSQIQKSPSRSF